MKTSGVSQVSVLTASECEEPIAALLERVFGVTPTIYFSAERNESTITAYVRAKTRDLRNRLPDVRRAIDELRELGLDVGFAAVRIARVKSEDWAESWKKHFKPITIGSALLIKPSWSKLKPKPGQAVVVLDPGLSFGTGQHATTSFCLRQIVAHRRGGARLPPSFGSKTAGSLLDLGCGSGILAISAAKLGFSPIDAFDFDPVAVRIAQKNCRTNRVENKVSITRKDLTRMPLHSRQKYNVICANLMAPLLIAERDRILNRLAPGGTLILAGILASEFDSVRKRYESAGLKLVADKIEREWHSGAFKNPL